MSFKKDYINYVLHSVIQSDSVLYNSNPNLKKLLEKIISFEDFFKVTYIVGKTAGLDIVFKYLLYISDKIDKSQITVFNLKDNFEYDLNNLKKICSRVLIKQGAVPEVISEIESTEAEGIKDSIKIDVSENETAEAEIEDKINEQDENEEETGKETDEGLSLVEKSAQQADEEMFELDSINKSVESGEEDTEESPVIIDEEESAQEDKDEYETDEIILETGDSRDSEHEAADESYEQEDEEAEAKEAAEMDLAFEVRKPGFNDDEYEAESEPEPEKASEIYNRFENKYYEEIKILEKLFSNLERDIKNNRLKKIDDRTAKSFLEIAAISGGLSNIAKELSFDIISNIFYTINLFFGKSLNKESRLTLKNIQLLSESLNVVHTLIKGGNYLNYQEIVDNIENLKTELEKPEQQTVIREIKRSVPPEEKPAEIKEEKPVLAQERKKEITEEKIIEQKVIEEIKHVHEEEKKALEPAASNVRKEREPGETDSITFKMKYLVKEFEKQFAALENMKGEYSKYDALEKIDELNYYLRMIAKISAAVKLYDVLKLAEVSYVFLKYLKDYRMNLFDAEIKQIINYIIFTFKMLLTDRKPEDFNILVQYLNNPVKIFADSN
jgi:hypothetical protein